jgi:two-component system NarL family sensor kinase
MKKHTYNFKLILEGLDFLPFINKFIYLLFALITMVGIVLPPNYVIGYLYIVPILLADSRLSHKKVKLMTIAGATFTLLDMFSPDWEKTYLILQLGNISIIIDRIIVVVALFITFWLAERNRIYQEALFRQNAKLQAQEQLANIREDFVATLSHDLKTPILGAIATLNSLLKHQFGSLTQPQEDVIKVILRSQNNSLSLVQNLLDIYQNDTEGVKLNCVILNLIDLIKEVVLDLKYLASTRDVSFYLKFPKNLNDFRIYGDKVQLQRVLSNLLINAINHAQHSGKVEVSVESDLQYHIIKIIDDGQGILKEELPYLFDRFYQGATNRHSIGSGLGLYLSRQIVEAHQGIIWAENRTTQGALFGFCLPQCSSLHNLQQI